MNFFIFLTGKAVNRYYKSTFIFIFILFIFPDIFRDMVYWEYPSQAITYNHEAPFRPECSRQNFWPIHTFWNSNKILMEKWRHSEVRLYLVRILKRDISYSQCGHFVRNCPIVIPKFEEEKLSFWWKAVRFMNNLSKMRMAPWEITSPWENVSYVRCEQQMRRSACASAQSDQHLYCSLPR